MAAVTLCRGSSKSSMINQRLLLKSLFGAINYSSSREFNESSSVIDQQLKKLENLKKRKEILYQRRKIIKTVRQDSSLEKAVAERSLKIPLTAVKHEWSKDKGLREVAFLAKYYGIFRDILNGNEFNPSVWLDITFKNQHVHRGNLLWPSQCLEKPIVSFHSNSHPYHSMMLVNPDGCHPFCHAEVLHWMKINANEKDTEFNNELTYIPPLPWKGSGFHRFCLLVFGHSKMIDKTLLENVVPDRFRFKTAEFLEKMENILTPIGLGWFQAQWDESVQKTAKNLGIFEPVFEWEQFKYPLQMRAERKNKLWNNKYRIKLTYDDILLAK